MEGARPWPVDPDYGATPDGRVFRLVDLGPRKRRKEMTQHLLKRGYFTVHIDGRHVYVHRIVAQCFLPNPDGKPYVAHNDGVKTNNHVGNLRWATSRENNHDMDLHGTRTVGEACSHAILTEAKVFEIRALVVGKPKRVPPLHKEVARQYGVTRECITRIANGDRWKHAIAP
jgi:hypothetical protein